MLTMYNGLKMSDPFSVLLRDWNQSVFKLETSVISPTYSKQ